MSQQKTEPARPPCSICGGSMDGEHHRAKAHKACKEGNRPVETTVPQESTVEMVPAPPKEEIRSDNGAIKVSVEEYPVRDPSGNTSEYWIGTLETCPYQNVTVGGIAFPLFTGQATFDDRCRVLNGAVARGALIHLTEKQVGSVVESIKRKAIRFVGKETERYIPHLAAGTGEPRKIMRARGQMVSVDGGQAREGDIPLAKFLYMIPTDSVGFHGRDRIPEPMLQE